VENGPIYDSSVSFLDLYFSAIFPIQKTGQKNSDGFDSFKDAEGFTYILIDPDNQNVPESESTNSKFLLYSNPSLIDDVFRIIESPPQDIITIFQNLNKTWYYDDESDRCFFYNGSILQEITESNYLQMGFPKLSNIKNLFTFLLIKGTFKAKLLAVKLKYKGKIRMVKTVDGKMQIMFVGAVTTAMIIDLLSAFIKTPLEVGQTLLQLQGLMLFGDWFAQEGTGAAGQGVYLGKISRDITAMKSSVENYEKVLNANLWAHSIFRWNIAQTATDAFFDAAKGNLQVYKLMLQESMNREEMRTAKDAGIINIYTKESYQIWADGIRYGKYSPTGMPLNPGNHVIELRAKTKITQTFNVSIRSYEVISLGSFDDPIALDNKIGVIEKAEGAGKEYNVTLKGKVTDVKDGDTIKLYERADIDEYDIRLNYIDAAEIAHKGSRADWGSGTVANLLSWLIEKEEVTVEVTEIDHYGRMVGTIFLNGLNINLLLVKVGAVKVYEKYLSEDVKEMYLDAQNNAKKEHYGIWSYSGNPKFSLPDEVYLAKHIPIPEKTEYGGVKEKIIKAYKYKGFLKVYTTEKYKIFVDDFYKSTTERIISLTPGIHEISIQAEYKKSIKQTVEIKYNETVVIGSKENKITLENEG
jgi:endonuclease YncB( thermonuclease family)